MHRQRKTGNPQLMRELNGAIVLDEIRRNAPTSRAEIAKRTHLSRPTVSRMVDELLRRGFVKETGVGDSTGGRRPTTLEFNVRAGFVAGVDLGGTKILCGVSDLGGNILSVSEGPSCGTKGGMETLEQLMALIRQACSDAGVTRDGLWAIAVGSPGVLDPKTGSFSLAPNLAGWDEVPLSRTLEREFGVRAILDNDVNMAAIGEAARGEARGVGNMIFISVGTGLGAGIILEGKLYRGTGGASGEIGYMILSDGESIDEDIKKHGFLESMVSGYGIARAARIAVAGGDAPGLLTLAQGDPSRITAETVFEAARSGDQVAVQIVDRACQYLALAIANLVSVFDPQLVVLGGGLIYRNPDFAGKAIAEARRLCPVERGICLSSLEPRAALTGAVHVALEAVLSSIGLEASEDA